MVMVLASLGYSTKVGSGALARMKSAPQVRAILRISAGFFLIAAGLVLSLPGVPGPGFLLIFLGLVLLAEHFHWARRARDWAKEKAARLKDRVQPKEPS